MSSNSCEIGTLASNIRCSELTNPNIVKVEVEKKLSSNIFSKAVDFCRISENNTLNLYHHIGNYFYQRCPCKVCKIKDLDLNLKGN